MVEPASHDLTERVYHPDKVSGFVLTLRGRQFIGPPATWLRLSNLARLRFEALFAA